LLVADLVNYRVIHMMADIAFIPRCQ
jgi:hypothetical protein